MQAPWSGAVKPRHAECLFVPTNASPREPLTRVSQLLNLVEWSIAIDSMKAGFWPKTYPEYPPGQSLTFAAISTVT